MTREQLETVLENHLHWINKDVENWRNLRADLCYSDLRYADLRCDDLSGAILRYADLRCANLRGANLRDIDLRRTNLSGANLSKVNLHCADLRGAVLRSANLNNADLRSADLRSTNLSNANLKDTDLRGADLRGATNVSHIPMACPDTGSFIGWKKAEYLKDKEDDFFDCIIKLEIPEDARRSSANSGIKCRCDKAKVLEIQSVEGDKLDDVVALSKYDNSFEYIVGKVVEEPNFCTDRFNECASGIHFFINRNEAVIY